jgi:hypothetical protein
MPRKVFVVSHVTADDRDGENAKMIGVYSSKEYADAAVVRLSTQPGFRDYTQGFEVGPYELDRDYWAEGFVPG